MKLHRHSKSLAVCLVACVVCLGAPLLAVQNPEQATPAVQRVVLNNITVYIAEEVARRARLAPEELAGRSAADLADAVRQVYREDGYSLATVESRFDAASGTLTLNVDEGRFEAVSIEGLDDTARLRILERLAIPAGEIFNIEQASRALTDALSVTQGAIVVGSKPFELVTEGGRRVLRVMLQAREGTGGVVFGTQGREDWFSPVDGFNPALGVNGTIFDRGRFNHTFWSASASYKFGPDRVGYSLGIERPFLAGNTLQIGASIHDLTASDDQWRLGDAEQSLVALTFRNTFRDYYRRKGFQVHAAVRPLDAHEVIVAWRDEAHAALANETNYGFFRDDHPFRANVPATPGDLRALLLGYTFDSRGLAAQLPAERYRRHLLDDLFNEPTGREPGMRLEWRSEIAPDAFDHEFDFTRHILTARGWWEPSPSRTVSGRVIGGLSSGTLPAQRILALGGIGSVHGYGFKAQAGERMVLMNGEFRQELGRSDVAGLVFLDVGRISGPGPWMKGVGVGFEFEGGARVEFGWRLDDVPGSLQVLFRLRPTF